MNTQMHPMLHTYAHILAHSPAEINAHKTHTQTYYLFTKEDFLNQA